MNDSFQVWIDRLKGGQTQKINENFDPTFLGIQEEELRFERPVAVKGEAYLSDEELILHLNASTLALMPCAICNRMIETKVMVENFYHAEPIANIPSGLFDFTEALREALLIELPKYIECGTKCPERPSIAPYIRSEKRQERTT